MANTLESLALELIEIAQTDYPLETKKFLRTEGNKLKRRVKSEAKRQIGKKTGNYMKGWKRGKPYKYAPDKADAIRVYNASPHAHLLEYGHLIVGHEPNKTSTGKRTRKFPVIASAENSFVSEFEADVDAFIDKIITKGLS